PHQRRRRGGGHGLTGGSHAADLVDEQADEAGGTVSGPVPGVGGDDDPPVEDRGPEGPSEPGGEVDHRHRHAPEVRHPRQPGAGARNWGEGHHPGDLDHRRHGEAVGVAPDPEDDDLAAQRPDPPISTMRPPRPPERFTWYMASSAASRRARASASIRSPSSPGPSGATATAPPMLAPTAASTAPPSGPASRMNGVSTRASTRPAARPAAAASGSPSSTATNSSPPMRASVSLGRSAARNRSATATSSRSPAPWPSESLTALNRSRSKKRTPTCPRSRTARARTSRRRSARRSRLASPVSPSWKAPLRNRRWRSIE